MICWISAIHPGDPGIVYNTVSILMDEFVEEYRRIRYGETDQSNQIL